MIVLALLLIAAGILAAVSLIVQKKPNAQEAIAKLTPYQGIIGIILLLWGLYSLLVDILLTTYFSVILAYGFPTTRLIYLLSLLVAIGLGILLGYGLIKKYALSNNAEAARSGDMVLAKLARIQAPLGIAGIALGLWMLIWRLFIFPSYLGGRLLY